MAQHVPLSLVDHHWKSKTILRVIVCILSAPVVALCIYEFVRFHETWYLFWMIPSALAIAWSLVNFLRQCAAHRPVHPGWNVFFDLLLWLALSAGGGYIAWRGARDAAQLVYVSEASSNWSFEILNKLLNLKFGDGRPDDITALSRGVQYTYLPYSSNKGVLRGPSSPDYKCPFFDSCMQQNGLASVLKQTVPIVYAAAGFFFVAGFFEFVLFIIACVNTSHYNRQQSIARHTARYEPSRHLDEENISRDKVHISINNMGQPGQPLMSDAQGAPRSSPRLSAPAGYNPYQGGGGGDLGDGGRRGRSVSHSSMEPYDGVDVAYKSSAYRPEHYNKSRSASTGSVSNAPLVVPADHV